MNEKDIVNIALENFEEATQYKCKWIAPAYPDNDGMIEIIVGDENFRFNIEIKKELRNYHLQDLFKGEKLLNHLIVIANNIFPNLKKEIRQHNAGYIEVSGNAYIKIDNVLIWIEGRKLINTEKETTNRAFTKTGLKVVFNILQNEDFLTYNYREIARIAGVGIGNINFILKGLIEAGYLVKVSKEKFKLINKKDLLNRWLIGYAEILRPTLETGTFRFLKDKDFINWKRIKLKNEKTYWGGEPAGYMLTKYINPENLILYTTEERNDIIKNYRLIPDPNGNVKIYKKFWYNDEANFDIAPPLLVYTDLINTGNTRCIETAQLIFNELLKGKYE